MNGVLIVNPKAGNGRVGRRWGQVEPKLWELLGARAEVWRSERPGHAEELAGLAAAQNADWVAVVGGDGTVHEVVNGLCRFQAQTGRQAPRLCFLPAGTGNDFARSHGIPLNPLAAAQALVPGQGKEVEIDIGLAGERYFVNIGGAGFDAEVAADANRSGKTLPGAMPYILSTFKILFTYRNQPMVIHSDGKRLERVALFVAVGVLPFHAGGMMMLPQADPTDGLLDVCIVGDIDKFTLVRLLRTVFTGGHVGHPKVEIFRAEQVEIEGSPALHVHSDGEIVGNLPIAFRCVPKALRLLRPATSSGFWQRHAEAGS